jgi:hypothetical protein
VSELSIETDVLAQAAEVLERAIAEHDTELPAESLQRLLAAAIRLFVARIERGSGVAPFPRGTSDIAPTATDVMVATTEFLAASEVELFELGMWQTWGGVGIGQAGSHGAPDVS